MLPAAESIQIILPVISIFFLFLTFKKSVYGAISYFIILNSKLGDMYPALGALRFELIAAIVVLVSIVLQKEGLKNIFPGRNELNRPLWILFVVGMVSVVQAVDVTYSWNMGGYGLLKLVLFYIMVVASINDRNDFVKMVWAFVLITSWTAYEPVVNYLSGAGEKQGYGEIAIGRFGAASGHVALANTLNQGIPLMFFWTLSCKKWRKLFSWALLALVVVGVVFTKSRGGFIGLIAIGAGLVFFSKNRIKSCIVVVCLFIFMIPFAGQDYLAHMSTITQGHAASRSASDRYLGLVNGVSMMIKRPILGVGIGCYPRARSIYFNYFFYSHNLYGELLGELGLASFFWFYWIYSIGKRASWIKKRLPEKDRLVVYILNGVQLGLFVRLVVGNFSHCAFIWFWFFMAALVVSCENICLPSHEDAILAQR